MSGNQTGAEADPQPTAATRAGTARDGGRHGAPRPEAARTSPWHGRRQQAPAAPRPSSPRGGGLAAPSSPDARRGTRPPAETAASRQPASPRPTGRADGGGPAFTAHRAGGAWLISRAGTADPRALAFAAGLAPDPECTVLVVDLPDEADGGTLDRLAQAVPPGETGLRLVFGRPPRPAALVVARRLAERLGRTVTAADGLPLPTPGGGLFIDADRGAGWVRCAPGAPDVRDSRRFPKPSWESVLPDRPRSPGTAVADPVPAGVWLRPVAEGTSHDDHRTRLSGRLKVSSELLTVVVGVPGAAPLPVADVARLWQSLPPHVRPAVRFVCYGPTRLSGGRHFGDVLAQVVGEPVRLYNGLPDGADDSGEVLLVRQDGSPGRPLLAQEFVHLPPTGSAGPPSPPFAAAHRWPLGDLPELGPGTHLLADDAVVEVVRSGLWVRLPHDPPYAAEVRSADPHPGRDRVLCDADSEAELPRLKRLAADLVRGFPTEVRRAVRLGVCRPTVPARGRPQERPAPRAGDRPSSPDAGGSCPEPGGGRVDGAPRLTAPDSGHEGSLSVAAEILRRHPELTADRPHPDAVAGLAAVLRRLAETEEPGGTGAEAAAGRPVPGDGELLRTGLRMLPVHRGATGLRATLDEAMRQWYAGQRLVVDPQVCEASALGPRDEPGNTDFLIWSVDGRRTDLLDPLCPDRVLFLPGSRFRVLGAEPGIPGVVMMREVGPGETPEDPGRDRAAVRELTRAWRGRRGDGGA
ncbi:hypothetical protein D9753_34975 [Streptomyces dangxiongensis]|uniref:Uncharacterized protein n=1 Tax=Streptomyces dangxiongensis TaxID=1442032 RepID=A0A3G2JLC4_9ACTN|nr:hypothetical protein [Streptomyces dangxiongensis]AYN43230.1 hypothetical protein D9753_34975 [Streptomyces dangxiongensis]